MIMKESIDSLISILSTMQDNKIPSTGGIRLNTSISFSCFYTGSNVQLPNYSQSSKQISMRLTSAESLLSVL